MVKDLLTVIIPLGKNRSIGAAEYLKKQAIPVQIYVEVGPNPSINRNRGIEKARTKYVAFLNGHSLPSPDWSSKVLSFFEKHPDIDVVGGPQLTAENENFIARVSGYALSSIFGAASVRERYIPGRINLDADEMNLTSANLIAKKKVLEKVKFDEEIYPGEDPKFISDCKNAGFRVAYSPDIFVRHERRGSIYQLAKQFFNYGYMRPKKERFNETLKKPAFLVPPMFVLYLTLLTPLVYLSKIFIFPMVLYISLNFIFSVYEGFKNNNFYAVLVLPTVYLTIHLSYGIGFILGWLRKLL